MYVVDDDVHPMALLTEEVKADEVETRIKAVRRLTTVAQALGLERTRSELVPFLRGRLRKYYIVVFLFILIIFFCRNHGR